MVKVERDSAVDEIFRRIYCLSECYLVEKNPDKYLKKNITTKDLSELQMDALKLAIKNLEENEEYKKLMRRKGL